MQAVVTSDKETLRNGYTSAIPKKKGNEIFIPKPSYPDSGDPERKLFSQRSPTIRRAF